MKPISQHFSINQMKPIINKDYLIHNGFPRDPSMLVSMFKEWLTVLKIEARRASVPAIIAMVWHIAVSLVGIRFNDKQYRDRIYKCKHCPIFEPKNLSCRNGDLGCGCYVPFKALVKSDCWGRQKIGGDFGWGESDDSSTR